MAKKKSRSKEDGSRQSMRTHRNKVKKYTKLLAQPPGKGDNRAAWQRKLDHSLQA